MDSTKNAATAELLKGECSFAAARNDDVLYSLKGKGVGPFLEIFERDPKALEGCDIADTVIGKAAAMLCGLAGVKSVYGIVMSENAMIFLKQHEIAFSYGESAPFIQNRTGTGLCPLEQSVFEIDDPKEGIRALKETIKELMKGG